MQTGRKMVKAWKNIKTRPVSYTHLDVYKRQVLIDGYYNSSMIYSKKVGSAHIHTADYYWLSTEITPAE